MNLTKLYRSVRGHTSQSMDQQIVRVLKESVKFDITEAFEVMKLTYEKPNVNFKKEHFNVPYPLTLFYLNLPIEALKGSVQCFILIADTRAGITIVTFYKNPKDKFYNECPCYAIIDDFGSRITFDSAQPIDPRDKDLFSGILSTSLVIVYDILKRMNNKTVKYVNQKPRGVKAKNTKKLKQFSYKVVSINHNITINQQEGHGSHCSPRAHDRMGHERHLKSGKVVWINSMRVGDPKLGTVEKEYKVK